MDFATGHPLPFPDPYLYKWKGVAIYVGSFIITSFEWEADL